MYSTRIDYKWESEEFMGVTVLTHVENAKWGLADLGNEEDFLPDPLSPFPFGRSVDLT